MRFPRSDWGYGSGTKLHVFHSPLAITNAPAGQTVNEGANVQFQAGAYSLSRVSYQWRSNGVNIVNQTNSTLSLANVAVSYSATYTVVATNTSGAVTSDPATLVVNGNAPIITNAPQTQSVVDGAAVSFSVAASGTQPFNFKWFFNGVPISGATDSSYSIATAHPSDSGSYSVIVSNSWGTVPSAEAVLTVHVPASITSQPQSQTVVQGNTATFSVATTGEGSISYQWLVNGNSIGGQTASALSISNAQLQDVTSYSVLVANAYATVTSSPATLAILPAPLRVANSPPIRTTASRSFGMFTRAQPIQFNTKTTIPMPCGRRWVPATRHRRP
ncbi:MAG: hypothetical protein JWO95_720 [Verrucomicrobiales bacterium]|nr:hypothetical protein [Verrucomicrobiales bacterium]